MHNIEIENIIMSSSKAIEEYKFIVKSQVLEYRDISYAEQLYHYINQAGYSSLNNYFSVCLNRVLGYDILLIHTVRSIFTGLQFKLEYNLNEKNLK